MYDLGLQVGDVCKQINFASKLGFKGVAFTRTLNGLTRDNLQKVAPPDVNCNTDLVTSIYKLRDPLDIELSNTPKFTVFFRLHVVLNEVSDLTLLHSFLKLSQNSKSDQFHIISVEIKSEKVLNNLLNLPSRLVDIIRIGLNTWDGFIKLKRKQINRLVQLGYMFELSFLPVLLSVENVSFTGQIAVHYLRYIKAEN